MMPFGFFPVSPQTARSRPSGEKANAQAIWDSQPANTSLPLERSQTRTSGSLSGSFGAPIFLLPEKIAARRLPSGEDVTRLAGENPIRSPIPISSLGGR